MPLLLVLLFIGIPILELSLIGQVQDLLGWPYTITILIADSVLGAMLVRQEGTRAWRRFTQALTSGQAPATEVVDGALILFGGALLLTPGFFTDAVGLLCVIGPSRAMLNRVLLRRFAVASGPLGALFTIGGRRAPKVAGSQSIRPPRADKPRPDPDTKPKDRGTTGRPPPPGVIDVEVLDVRRNPRKLEE